MSGRYGDLVRRLAADPAHAGSLDPAGGPVREAEVSALERGAWVRFELRVQEGVVREARFRAWGCPHVLAACELAAARLEGRPPGQVDGLSAASLAQALQAPPDKMGRLLVVEDALAALAAATAVSK
jgi:NifU-like protein involved in Fe-S cluster formation